LAALTDPARELVELLENIEFTSNRTGADHIARTMGVEAWSVEFHEILASIINRLELLRTIIRSLDMDQDFKDQVIGNVNSLQSGFDGGSLVSRWDQRGTVHFITATNIAAIKSLSPLVRSKIKYPKLTDEEIGELVGLTDTLEEWLNERQLSEHDFIRQAILDGIKSFKFRLQRLRWLGWGYTVQSLRDVIGAYLALERGTTSKSNPDAEAVLKKVAAWVRKVSETANVIQEKVDNVGLMLKAYGAYSLVVSGQATVAGLIGTVTS